MSWSKVKKGHKKPWRWWVHKILAEYGWLVRHRDGFKTYKHHLEMACKQGLNLYGEPYKSE